jgi:hypothetical protein
LKLCFISPGDCLNTRKIISILFLAVAVAFALALYRENNRNSAPSAPVQERHAMPTGAAMDSKAPLGMRAVPRTIETIALETQGWRRVLPRESVLQPGSRCTNRG